MRGEVLREREEKNYYKNLLMSRMGLGSNSIPNPKKPPVPLNRGHVSMFDQRARLELEHAKKAAELKKAEESK